MSPLDFRSVLGRAVLKAAAVVLGRAGDQFGNHGCNDLDLQVSGLSRAEQEALVSFMGERNGDPEENPRRIAELPNTTDFGVMFACAAWLEAAAKDEPRSASALAVGHRSGMSLAASKYVAAASPWTWEQDAPDHWSAHSSVHDDVVLAVWPHGDGSWTWEVFSGDDDNAAIDGVRESFDEAKAAAVAAAEDVT